MGMKDIVNPFQEENGRGVSGTDHARERDQARRRLFPGPPVVENQAPGPATEKGWIGFITHPRNMEGGCHVGLLREVQAMCLDAPSPRDGVAEGHDRVHDRQGPVGAGKADLCGGVRQPKGLQ